MFWNKTSVTLEGINAELTKLVRKYEELEGKIYKLEHSFMSLNNRVNRKLNYTLEQPDESSTESNLNEDGLGALRGI